MKKGTGKWIGESLVRDEGSKVERKCGRKENEGEEHGEEKGIEE